jgi:hypothetical protein
MLNAKWVPITNETTLHENDLINFLEVVKGEKCVVTYRVLGNEHDYFEGMVPIQEISRAGKALKENERIITSVSFKIFIEKEFQLLLDKSYDHTFWPKSLDEAVSKLKSQFTEDQLLEIQLLSKEEFETKHLWLGSWIRNYFGLWRGNFALLLDCDESNPLPDNVSDIIRNKLWESLQSSKKQKTKENNREQKSIRIHPKGSKISDYEKGEKLRKLYPNAFKIVQEVLVDTDNYLNKKGQLSNVESRIKKLQKSIYNLLNALLADGFMSEQLTKYGPTWIIFDYMSLFSDAFPNWQDKYHFLNKFVPENFPDASSPLSIGGSFIQLSSELSSIDESQITQEKVASGIREATKDIVTDADSAKECGNICTNDEGGAWLYTELMIQKIYGLLFVILNAWGENHDWANFDFFSENVKQGITQNHKQKQLSTVLMKGFFRILEVEGEGPALFRNIFKSSSELVRKRDENVNETEIITYLDNKVNKFIKGLDKYFS